MTPAEQDLARQLARRPEWVWMDGMLSNVGRITLDRAGAPGAHSGAPRLPSGHKVSSGNYPDLSDPATQGCLIAALGERLQVVEPFYKSLDPNAGRMWCVETRLDTSEYPWISEGATLGEALAKAWLAVNGEDPKP